MGVEEVANAAVGIVRDVRRTFRVEPSDRVCERISEKSDLALQVVDQVPVTGRVEHIKRLNRRFHPPERSLEVAAPRRGHQPADEVAQELRLVGLVGQCGVAEALPVVGHAEPVSQQQVRLDATFSEPGTGVLAALGAGRVLAHASSRL